MKRVSRAQVLRSIVERLCAPECRGRAPGTPGGEAGRAIILAEVKARGLEPAAPGGGFEQQVPGCGGANVIARVPGTGGERAILLAAHHDHLGVHGGETFWGADDNAAAVAILLETASALAAACPRGREVLIAFFDGEEPPHYLSEAMGSMWFTLHPPLPLERLDAMVCMDLMGHAVGGPAFPEEVRRSVFVLGAEHGEGLAGIVDRAASRAPGVRARRMDSDVIPPLSDHWAFQNHGVPFLFLTCGRWAHYHTPEDTPEKLDYAKMDATVELLASIARELAAHPSPVRWVPRGRDDAGTIASLLDVARQLGVAPAVQLLERLAAKRALSEDERRAIPMMVARLEELLAG